MNKKRKSFPAYLSKYRLPIQIAMGMATYSVVSFLNISLWWVVAFGSFTGVIWGKVFCRWMCPMGIMMEMMMKLSPDDSFKNMYQYHQITRAGRRQSTDQSCRKQELFEVSEMCGKMPEW